MKKITSSLVLLIVLSLVACGGGGSSSGSGSGGITQTLPITITTDPFLPVTLNGQPYSTTLAASNGKGALKWSIRPISPTTLFVDGLTIDSATGVLSGKTTFLGTAGFVATVTDANSQTASKNFNLTAYGPLTQPSPLNLNAYQYSYTYGTIDVQGGVPPLKYSVSSGSLPPGISIDSTGRLRGSATKSGTFSAMITVQDSWTTPQSSVQAVNINVSTATLYVLSNLDQNLLVNRAANRALYAAGGVPPYTFQITWGSLPAGLTLDANSGKITGVPTTVGTTFLTAQVKDSVGSTYVTSASVNVVQARGRNDSIQAATPTLGGATYASLSPYIDPPDKAPTAGDTDYYKFDTMAGSVVNISTNGYGTGPIDTVIEVLDANGFRLSTCHFPDDQAGTYTSSCINDEASSTGHNSALDYQMPGSAPSVGTVYVHVLDWRGDARPDMQYILNVNGITAPMIVQLGAVRGVPYTYTFGYVPNAYGTTTWSLDKGTMPDGLAISSAGLISGTPTTDGTYSFGLKILDSATPPKTLYALVTMVVAEPVIITSTATLPTACLGKAYSFQVQATGGVAPLMYWSNPGYWPSLSINQSTGVLSGTPSLVGTFPGRITVSDLGGNSDSQIATLTVQNCP